jgi:hypothetical protein
MADGAKGSEAGVEATRGLTMLHMAAEAGNLKLVMSQVKDGADLFAVDSRGKTPREVAKTKTVASYLALSESEARMNSEPVREWAEPIARGTFNLYFVHRQVEPRRAFDYAEQMIHDNKAFRPEERDVILTEMRRIRDHVVVYGKGRDIGGVGA